MGMVASLVHEDDALLRIVRSRKVSLLDTAVYERLSSCSVAVRLGDDRGGRRKQSKVTRVAFGAARDEAQGRKLLS